ncbi:MAG: 16S rRNA (guanine(966)-N(2))-methyltransferase RsmD [Nitrospirae bacterium]|nr:16S rRNA (guanine(966)-N(2))-methyltransferase RsmD [Nitrospirota bacterium]MBI3594594.1 16S rRNA (guanine(966)-N(2))-methyltransferase RsmD [Nitrospirota bacterium]
MIRISGGKKRGRHLFTLDDPDLRPTSGKVREALFNILGEKINGVQFLDLFAGSGLVGIEALSRGAAHCTFIEKDFRHFKLLQKNIERIQFQNDATLIEIDALKFVKGPSQFDLVFVDPPYASKLLEKILPALGGSDMIEKGGMIIVEHFKKLTLDPIYGRFSLLKSYAYGDTFLSIYHASEKGNS